MKKLICAGVALSSLFGFEQGWGISQTILDTLETYEIYEHQTKRTVEDRKDAINRYDNEMKTFNGTNFEVSDDGTKLNIFSVDGNSKILLESKENKTDSWFAYDFSGGKLLWYRNSLILWKINKKSDYSFLADRVYTFGDLNCNELTIGAREGFMNFADINVSHIKVFTHAGQDCGSITTSSKNPNQNSSYDEHLVEDFFGNYGNNTEILNTAFNDGWKSVGSLNSESVEFDGLDANIHGSLNAKSVTMRGVRLASDGKTELKPELLIGNPWISESFTNTWLDWLRSKEAFERAEVNITNLNMQNGATVTIPNATSYTRVHHSDNERSVYILNITGAEVKNYTNTGEGKLVTFLQKTGYNKGFLSFLNDQNEEIHDLPKEKSEVTVEYSDRMNDQGKKHNPQKVKIRYKKIGNNIWFFGKNSNCRFDYDREQRLKDFLSGDLNNNNDNGNGGNGGGDDNTPKKLDDDDDKIFSGVHLEEEEEDLDEPSGDNQTKTDADVETFDNWIKTYKHAQDVYKNFCDIENGFKKYLKNDKITRATGEISLFYNDGTPFSTITLTVERNKSTKGKEVKCLSKNGNEFGDEMRTLLGAVLENYYDNDDDDIPPESKPEKKEVKKEKKKQNKGDGEPESNIDLNDPVVKRLDEWSKDSKLGAVSAEIKGNDRLQSIKNGTTPTDGNLFNVQLANDTIYQLQISFINGKFVFYTKDNKMLSKQAQQLLNKVANLQLSAKNQGVLDLEANNVLNKANLYDAGGNNNNK